MKHLVDIANLNAVSEMKFKASDQLLILCNNMDTITIDQVTMLSEKKVALEFVRYENEEEKMVLFGYLLGKHGANILAHGMELPSFLQEKTPAKRTRTVTKTKVEPKTAAAAKETKKSPAKTVKQVPTKEPAKAPVKAPKTVDKSTETNAKGQTKVTTKKAELPRIPVAKATKSDDERVEALKKLLKITAEDIQYSFDTNFMMGRIISYVSTATSDEDVRNALEFNFRSDTNHIVADAVMKNLAKVRKIINQ